MTSTALFVVRATVADPSDRAAFDAWYRDEHLSDAIAAFGAIRGWRAWSESDPAVHYAFYEMTSVAAAQALPGSPALDRLIGEFDARWQGRIPRSREILRLADGSTAPGQR